ncbi:uncharacterized protein LOC143850625 [Tasmannia lanceolata]|uniref:uncharacterized protein LOC143850625 n=1 Tax=Tasmannia lanceolata TaxID=3420 RepID=UPI0040642B46
MSLLFEIHQDGSWNPQIDKPSLREEKIVLKQILLSEDGRNHPIWKPAIDGFYSTKIGWNTFREKSSKPPWVKTVWFSGHTPRSALTTWKALVHKLSTKDRISFLGIAIDTTCPLCHSESESIDHLFFRCSYSSWLWKEILWRSGHRKRLKSTHAEEEEWVRSNAVGKGQAATVIKICFSSLIHHIWIERNRRIFEATSSHKRYVVNAVLMEASIKMNGIHLKDNCSDRNINSAKNFNYQFVLNAKEEKFCSWALPEPFKFKLNADASLDSAGGGIGGLIRDSKGILHSMFSENVEKEEIYELEMLDIEKGVHLALSMGIDSLWIESDSKFVVDIIRGNATVPWKKRGLLAQLKNLLNRFHESKITHTWREGNAAADILSKRIYPCIGTPILVLLATPALLSAIDDDRNGTLFLRL